MNKKIIIGVGVLLLMLLGVFLVLFFLQGQGVDKGASSTLPDTGTVSGSRPTSAPGNSNFSVRNFIQNGETTADPANDGTYILAGETGYCLPDGTCPKGYETEQFSVSYTQESDSFTLVILSEPLATVRIEAEQFLMQRLGVSEEEMCRLRYSLSAPYWVNEFYAGRELGFSFCPGSVVLE